MMDTDQHGVFRAVYQRHPVFQVRDLSLPDSGTLSVGGHVLTAGHHRLHPGKSHQIPDPHGNLQIQPALRHRAVTGDSAAILPTVAWVQYHDFPGRLRPGREHLGNAAVALHKYCPNQCHTKHCCRRDVAFSYDENHPASPLPGGYAPPLIPYSRCFDYTVSPPEKQGQAPLSLLRHTLD